MRLMPIITLLKAGAPLLTSVEPAASLVALDSSDINAPIAYVHPVNDKTESNQLLGGNVSQTEAVQFAVLIAAHNINVDTSVEELEDVRDQIKTALLAQIPAANYGPIEHVAGDIVDVTSQIIWWRDTFQAANLLRG